jgi:hypothetical protein
MLSASQIGILTSAGNIIHKWKYKNTLCLSVSLSLFVSLSIYVFFNVIANKPLHGARAQTQNLNCESSDLSTRPGMANLFLKSLSKMSKGANLLKKKCLWPKNSNCKGKEPFK